MRSLFRSSTATLCIAACTLPAPAFAMNILLCNDDGISAANVRALKKKLTDAGHSVIVTAPADNMSGSGGYIPFRQPIGTLKGTERSAVDLGLAAGAAGVGNDPRDADVYYVNSTPVASCLYGIDIVSQKKWQAKPDLVISGPNEGNNTGAINPSSGTFNNMVYAVNRGLPALAVSDYSTNRVAWSESLPADARAYEIAGLVVSMVGILQTSAQSGRGWAGSKLMPAGIGLNINIPAFDAGQGASLPYKYTRLGTSTSYMPVFSEKLSDSVAQPGIGLAAGGSTLPNGTVLPADTAESSEQNALNTKAITISPVLGAADAALW